MSISNDLSLAMKKITFFLDSLLRLGFFTLVKLYYSIKVMYNLWVLSPFLKIGIISQKAHYLYF